VFDEAGTGQSATNASPSGARRTRASKSVIGLDDLDPKDPHQQQTT
jgi:hypothetical protein